MSPAAQRDLHVWSKLTCVGGRATIQCSSVSYKRGRIGGHWFESLAHPLFILQIEGGHRDRIHSSLTAVHRFHDGYLEK